MTSRTPLADGSELHLVCQNENTYDIRIETCISTAGGSCIVYRGFLNELIGSISNERTVIVKEYYPKSLIIERTNDNSLNINDRELFEEKSQLFLAGLSNHSKYYEMSTDSSLARAFIYGEANNTYYAISDISAGNSLLSIMDNVEEKKLSFIADIMASICNAFVMMHKKKYLYLDCKPDNIFYLPGMKGDAKAYLFDFDTLTREDEIKNNTYEYCSYSMGWAAPEQLPTEKGGEYSVPDQIGVHTDLFSIGMVFFWLLTGYKPEYSAADDGELRDIINGKFDWKKESDICKTASDNAIFKINDIFNILLQHNAIERRKKIVDNKRERGCNTDTVGIQELFEDLHAITCGDDKHYAPIHEKIDQSSAEVKRAVEDLKKTTSEEIRNNSIKNIIKTNKKVKIVFIVALFLIAIVMGLVISISSELSSKLVFSLDTGIDVQSDDYLLLELENASHQYEVGLENWKRLDYIRAQRDIVAAKEELSKRDTQDDIEVAKINNSLGCLYLDMGKYETAYDCLNSAYVAFKNAYGENSREASAVLFSIAKYDYYTGDLETAIKTAQRILDSSDKNDLIIRTTVNHFLATVYDSMGEYNKAIEYCKDALSAYEDFVKDGKLTKKWVNYTSDPNLNDNEKEYYTTALKNIATIYNDMGRMLFNLEKYDDALKQITMGLNLCLDNIYIGTKDLTTAKLYLNMARVQAALGAKEQAKESADLAMRIERNLFDFEDVYPGMVEVFDVYGNLLKEDDVEASEEYFQKAISLAVDSFGENHYLTSEAYYSMGAFRLGQGENKEAIEYISDAIEIRKNILSYEHPDVVKYLISLAKAEKNKGDQTNAENSIKEAKRIGKKFGMEVNVK